MLSTSDMKKFAPDVKVLIQSEQLYACTYLNWTEEDRSMYISLNLCMASTMSCHWAHFAHQLHKPEWNIECVLPQLFNLHLIASTDCKNFCITTMQGGRTSSNGSMMWTFKPVWEESLSFSSCHMILNAERLTEYALVTFIFCIATNTTTGR